MKKLDALIVCTVKSTCCAEFTCWLTPCFLCVFVCVCAQPLHKQQHPSDAGGPVH